MADMVIKNIKSPFFESNELFNIYINNCLISDVVEASNDTNQKQIKAIDCHGLTALPAFVDLHCHFRDPGFTQKETIETGSKAAAKGGYTFVNLMANTKPVCSSNQMALANEKKAKDIGLVDINQVISITENFDGQTLDHLKSIDKPIKVISEDGKWVMDNEVMAKAAKFAADNDIIVMSHTEEMKISKYDYYLAENVATSRDIAIGKHYKNKMHFSHCSTKVALSEIANAKKDGYHNITCEVAPHHIWQGNEDGEWFKNPYRVNPPIRSKEDAKALVEGIRKGTVDAIATDHAPHTAEDKANGAPGLVGLETAFGVCYTQLVERDNISLKRVAEVMSKGPAEILGLNKGKIEKGFDGDIVIVDTDEKWVVDPEKFASKGRNTPFKGETLTGKVVATIKGGEITYFTPGKVTKL